MTDGCGFLLEDGSGVLLLESGDELLQEECPETEPAHGGFVFMVPKGTRRVGRLLIPLDGFDDDEEAAMAIALLQSLRGRRRTNG